MNTHQFEIDPEDDTKDVEEAPVLVGEGGEPIEFYEPESDFMALLLADEDLIESADVAVQATIAALDDEADTYEYRAHEADEVLALTVGQLIALAAHNAMLDDPDNPNAAAHAVYEVLHVAKEAVTADLGAEAFPTLVIDGIDEIVEPT